MKPTARLTATIRNRWNRCVTTTIRFIVDVERYRYEPHGQSYNVFFEQPTWRIGTQEFVMYNPRDEHVMIVHNQDLLESTQEEVDRERNFHGRAARDAGVRHLKYVWFD